MRPTLLALVILSLSVAGCAGVEPTDGASAVDLAVAPDAPPGVAIELAGAWMRSDGMWHRLAPAGTLLGEDAWNVSASLAPGRYDTVRVVLSDVSVDGASVVLAENGFELPLNVTLQPATTTRLTFTFAWEDALFPSQNGTTFLPALQSIEVTRDGEPILRLIAREIQTSPTKTPVARMEIFDAQEARVFQTDFVAESPKSRIIAAGPNITFQAATSEAVEAGATLERFEWEFGDGTSASGPTVSHAYPLSGGNFTVRLTVTDSLGVADGQTVPIALAAGKVSAKSAFTGALTGLYPDSCDDSTDGAGMASHALPVDPGATPEGVPADLVRARFNLFAIGNPHAGADMDLRVLDPAGDELGTSGGGGTDEEVVEAFDRGAAPAGDWTIEIKPCLALQLDYEVVATLTWVAKEPEPGYAAWLSQYDDGHDHEH